MPDPVHDRRAASGANRVRYGPTRSHVVDDRPTWLLVEHRAGEECGHEVARHEVTAVVDEEAPIRVAVEGYAEIGPLVEHLLDHERSVLRQERVGLVIREGAVGVEEATDRLDRKALEDPGQHRPGHAIRRVDHDPKRLDHRWVDEREHPVREGRVEVMLAPLPAPGRLLTEA